jgi:WD40 repeat protein
LTRKTANYLASKIKRIFIKFSFIGYKNEKYRIESIFDKQDFRVISGSEDGNVVFWDLDESEPKAKIKKHTRAVLTLNYSVSPNENQDLMLSGGADGKVVVWEATGNT